MCPMCKLPKCFLSTLNEVEETEPPSPSGPSWICRVHPIELRPRTKRLEQLLRGLPPLPSEQEQIAKRINTLPERIAGIEEHLVQMHRALDILHFAHQRMLRDYNDSLELLRQPQPHIHRLPKGVMERILSFSIFEDVDESVARGGYSSVYIVRQHWLLMNVCRGWAEIIRTASWIWDFVGVRFKAEGIGHVRSQEKLLRKQLAFAKNEPLKVAITCDGIPQSEHPVLKLLLSSSPRWKTLIIDAPFSALTTLLAPIKGTLDKLMNLRLVIQGRVPPEQGQGSIDIFEDAPCLQDIKINAEEEIMPHLRIQFGKLVNYYMHQVKQTRNVIHWAAIRDAPQMGTFAARCEEDKGHGNMVEGGFESEREKVFSGKNTDKGVFVHAGLKHLFLEALTGADMERFLSPFSFPNLNRLDIYIQRGEARLGAITSFLRRSAFERACTGPSDTDSDADSEVETETSSTSLIDCLQLFLGPETTFENEELLELLEFTPLVSQFSLKLPRGLPQCIVEAMDPMKERARSMGVLLPNLQWVIVSSIGDGMGGEEETKKWFFQLMITFLPRLIVHYRPSLPTNHPTNRPPTQHTQSQTTAARQLQRETASETLWEAQAEVGVHDAELQEKVERLWGMHFEIPASFVIPSSSESPDSKSDEEGEGEIDELESKLRIPYFLTDQGFKLLLYRIPVRPGSNEKEWGWETQVRTRAYRVGEV